MGEEDANLPYDAVSRRVSGRAKHCSAINCPFSTRSKCLTCFRQDAFAHKPPQLRVVRILLGQLFDTIRRLVAQEKYVVGEHASERLEERGVLEWQVVAGLDEAELIVERPDATPNPAVEVRESLPDGTEAKVVWSHLRQSGVAKLVTDHFFDRG